MKQTRLQRIVKLLGLLQGGRPHNARQLAEACHVAKRTIFRDLKDIRAAGAPLLFDDEKQQYQITAQYFPGAAPVTESEAAALVILCHELGRSAALPFMEAALSAAVKIENALPERVRQRIRQVTSAVEIRLATFAAIDGARNIFAQLSEAIARRKCVRITYGSLFEDQPIQTKVSPYKLMFHLHSWYCVGRSSIHRSVRTFHVGRITELQVLDESYKIPRGFNTQRHFGNAWRMIREPGPDQKVVVHFSRRVASNVAEVLWHPTQKTTRLDDGRLRFEVRVAGLNEIAWWILGYGDQAIVVEPSELRALLGKHAANLAREYAASVEPV